MWLDTHTRTGHYPCTHTHTPANLDVCDGQGCRWHQMEWMHEVDIEPALVCGDLKEVNAVEQAGRTGLGSCSQRIDPSWCAAQILGGHGATFRVKLSTLEAWVRSTVYLTMTVRIVSSLEALTSSMRIR